VNDRTDAVLASIDGALMDPEIPDGMRWSPEPEHVSDPDAMPYDGEVVPQPHQHYERTVTADTLTITLGIDPSLPISARDFPRVTTSRGGLRFGRQSHAQGTQQGATTGPPPPRRGQVPDRAEVERRRTQIAQAFDVPPELLGGWRDVGTLTPESTVDLRAEASRSLHEQAERVRAEARAMIPRVSDHTPTRALDTDPGLLIVEEYTNGLITVRRASPDETAEVVRRTWEQLVEAFRPLVVGVGEASRQIGEAFRAAGIPTTGPPTTPEARRSLGLPPLSPADQRQAALDARRHRHTGPPPLGPERSRRPRTHR
jgi:hypothetical protein